MADEIKEEVTPETENEDQVVDNPEETPTDETPDEKETETPKEEDSETPAEEETDEDKSDDESEDEESDEEEEKESAYNDYEHPALKQAVRLLEEAEIPVDEANAIFAEAVESGDLSKINKKALVEKLGQDKADVVLVLAESYYNTTFSKMNAIKEEAFSITGGEENFNAMREWASEKAKSDPEFAKDLGEFRSMIDSQNPRAIKAAVGELFDIYRQDPDTTIAADLEVGDKAASTAGLEPLSREAYINEIEKAHRNGTYDKVHKSLWARRNAGIKKGI